MNLKIHSYLRVVVLAVAIIFIGACAGTGRQYANQPVVSIGSKIQLEIAAIIPLGQDRVHIQNNRLVSKLQIDTYSVYCSVIMEKYQEEGMPQLRIETGEFTVSRVRLYNDYVHNPIIYANNDDRYWYPSGGVVYRTELYLESPDQPLVRALTRTNNQAEYKIDGYFPLRSHFVTVMGDFIRFQ